MITTEKMLGVLVEAADTLVDDFDLVDFLQRVVENTATVSGTTLVGLLLVDERGRLQLMASTTAATEQVELFQLQNDDGPCLDCFHTQAPVSAPDLAGSEGRWPVFVPNAVRQGMRSVHAFPLRLRSKTIGALNVFGTTPLPLTEQEIAMVQSLADVATIAIIQERAARASNLLNEQLQGALDTRIVIEQAKGAVAQAYGIGLDEAFQMIRAYSRRNSLRLTEVSRAIGKRDVAPRDLQS